MDNIIELTTQDGSIIEVEVLEIFGVVGYEDKEYILYTQNSEIDEDNIKAYVSILEQREDGGYHLANIEDEQEFLTVQKAIEEMGEVEDE